MTRELRVSPCVSSRSAARVCRVDEAERREPFFRGVDRQGARSREGVEDRREEEALVDRADRRLMCALVGFEGFDRGLSRAVAVFENAGQADEPGLVCRQRVRLLLVPELQTVLHRAEERVRGAELLGVGRLDVSRGRELVERIEGGAGTDALVVAAVHELEQLHCELDVANAAATTLELPIREALLLQLGLRPALHRPHLADGVGVESLGEHEGARQIDEAPAQPCVARDRTRLQEGLELPVARPALVPRRVRIEGA